MVGNGFLPRMILCLLGAKDDKSHFKQILDQEKIEHEFDEPDSRMVRAFESSGMGAKPSLTQADLNNIAGHSLVLYILSEYFGDGDAEGATYSFLQFGRRLLEAGATAMKCESSGIAHSKQRWIELALQSERGTADGSIEFWSALFEAYVQFPIASEEDFYSCGMHLLGKPDVIISTEVLQQARPDSTSQTDDPVYLFDIFCMYLLSECPDGKFASGHTFQPDFEWPPLRIIWEECHDYEPDDPYFNPFGRWRFTALA